MPPLPTRFVALILAFAPLFVHRSWRHAQAFSKLKALLRKAAERTVEGLWSAIGRLVDTVTPDERNNFFAAAGYEPD